MTTQPATPSPLTTSAVGRALVQLAEREAVAAVEAAERETRVASDQASAYARLAAADQTLAGVRSNAAEYLARPHA